MIKIDKGSWHYRLISKYTGALGRSYGRSIKQTDLCTYVAGVAVGAIMAMILTVVLAGGILLLTEGPLVFILSHTTPLSLFAANAEFPTPFLLPDALSILADLIFITLLFLGFLRLAGFAIRGFFRVVGGLFEKMDNLKLPKLNFTFLSLLKQRIIDFKNQTCTLVEFEEQRND